MANVTVLIPTPLRKFTGNLDTVTVEAGNIAQMLQALDAAHPGLGKPLMDENGNPRRFVNLYVGGEDIRFKENAQTVLSDGDEVSIVPAIAGGATGSEVYQLTFHRGMYNTPLLYNLGKKFRVTVNLRRAMMSEEAGFAEIELTGPDTEIGRAIADLQTTGVSITGPVSDRIEPDYDQALATTVGRGT